ncbi:hypothetical protein [Actinoallomurus sp. NPDC052274]|uniref:hypothetical protein n=1 Tax=Actinoallomurus sp. NPDC052274 TaxID=3155420 RepID=UPI003429B696
MSGRSIAERIDERVKEEVHDCIAPGCGRRAETAFIANEPGRFAGRHIEAGQFIDLCAVHAGDVYRAQGVTDVSQLPEWLRVDAGPQP